MKLSNLLTAKRNITEKRKVYFLVTAIVVVLAIIAGLIFGLVNGNPFNASSDFVDSYGLTVRSTSFNEDNFKDYDCQIREIIEGLEDSEGKDYGLKVYESYYQGKTDSSSIYFKYSSAGSGEKMTDEVNPALQEKIQSIFNLKAQSSKYDSGKVTLNYSEQLIQADFSEISEKITEFCAENSLTASNITLSSDKKAITFDADSAINAKLGELETATALEKEFAGKAELGERITPVVTRAILWVTISAIIAAMALLAIYVAYLFELSSAIAMFLSQLCDAVFMLAIMTICHITLNATFLAAVVLVLVFSSITKLSVFDRIREIRKRNKNKKTTRFETANTALSETMTRNFFTSAVMLGLAVLVLIIAAPSVRLFALPVIFGILINVFTTVFLAPSIWTLFKGVDVVERVKKVKAKKIEPKPEAPAKPASRLARPEIITPVETSDAVESDTADTSADDLASVQDTADETAVENTQPEYEEAEPVEVQPESEEVEAEVEIQAVDTEKSETVEEENSDVEDAETEIADVFSDELEPVVESAESADESEPASVAENEAIDSVTTEADDTAETETDAPIDTNATDSGEDS